MVVTFHIKILKKWYCAKNTDQQISLGRVVKVHLDTGQSILLVNSGQLQLLSYRKHQALSKGMLNVEMYLLSQGRRELK